jgi:hypothetical protein
VRAPGAAGGVFLVTRQLLDPAYKPEVFQDPAQRLAFVRMIALARFVDNGTLRRGQLQESVRQLSERCEMSRAGMARLLARLEEDGSIVREKASQPRVPDTITIVNFEAWQDSLGGYFNGTHNETQSETRRKRSRSKANGAKTRGSETQSETQSETSLTKDKRRINEEQITASAASASAPVSWSAAACDAWTDHFGGRAPGGEIGKHLKPVVDKYGAAEVIQQWDAYLDAHVRQNRAQFAKAADFAQRYGYYKQHGHKMARGKLSANEKLAEHYRRVQSVDLNGGVFHD